jgi:hypothetical protein
VKLVLYTVEVVEAEVTKILTLPPLISVVTVNKLPAVFRIAYSVAVDTVPLCVTNSSEICLLPALVA